MHRTSAQYAADRRRSHKASAKREQRAAALQHRIVVDHRGRGSVELTQSLELVRSMMATSARRSLNFVLTGQYADFV